MANQMIALGVRGPQLPNLGAAAAQMGNVMANMAVAKEKQAGVQRANAFRQLISSPQFDPSNPESIKAAQALDPAGAEKIASAYDARQKAQLERIGEQTKQFRDILAIIDPNDKETYAQFRDEVVSAVPGWASRLPTPEQWNADTRLRTLMKADDVISKTIATPTASAQQDASGNFYGVTVGGLNPPTATPVQEMTMGGQGGPLEAAPQMMPGGNTPARDLLRNLASVRNDAEYQTILSVMDRANPTMAQQLRAAAPRFNPQVLRQIVAEGAQAIGGADMAAADNALVAGERGGVGGPFEPTGRQFRGRVPAPPVGPQPRETAEEAAAKRRAVLEVEADFARNAPPPKPTPLTEAQRLARRDALAGNYKKSQALLDKTYGKAGIVDAVSAVRNLSRDQKEAITGYSAYAPSIFGSSKDADTAIKNLKGTVTELGQQAATASGAIGPMAVQEWKIVADMIANLELEGMTAEGLDSQLNIIEEKAKNAARLTQQAYDAQYGADVKTMPEFRLRVPGSKRAAPNPGSQYPVMTPEQVRKAPSGTRFRTTDGRLGEKP